MHPEHSVILIGYRGSGKSTVGRALADRLGYGFVDSDTEVVRRFGGVSIREIWAEHGEPAFREVEADVVEAVVAEPGHVVALGGGAVIVTDRARAAVRSAAALRVYLRADADVLAARIAGDTQTDDSRPSLTGKQSVTDEVAAVLAERDPVYRDVADVVLDVSELALAEVVASIVTRLREA